MQIGSISFKLYHISHIRSIVNLIPKRAVAFSAALIRQSDHSYKCSNICTISSFVGTLGFVAVHASARAFSAMESIALKYSVLSIPHCDTDSGTFIS